MLIFCSKYLNFKNKLCIKLNIDVTRVLYPMIVKLIYLLGEIFLVIKKEQKSNSTSAC